MNEHNQHPVEEVRPAVRVVVMPGTPWHETIGAEESGPTATAAHGRPWPGQAECPDEDQNCESTDQAGSQVCMECGHPRHQAGRRETHAYTDYALVEQVFLASGEPVSAGEICKCPCHCAA